MKRRSFLQALGGALAGVTGLGAAVAAAKPRVWHNTYVEDLPGLEGSFAPNVKIAGFGTLAHPPGTLPVHPDLQQIVRDLARDSS